MITYRVTFCYDFVLRDYVGLLSFLCVYLSGLTKICRLYVLCLDFSVQISHDPW
jgi:hypothetical protein